MLVFPEEGGQIRDGLLQDGPEPRREVHLLKAAERVSEAAVKGRRRAAGRVHPFVVNGDDAAGREGCQSAVEPLHVAFRRAGFGDEVFKARPFPVVETEGPQGPLGRGKIKVGETVPHFFEDFRVEVSH